MNSDSVLGLETTCGGNGKALNCFCGGDLCGCKLRGGTFCGGCEDCEDDWDDLPLEFDPDFPYPEIRLGKSAPQ